MTGRKMVGRKDQPSGAWLAVPGNQKRLLESATGADCDGVVIDLEDAVPENAKAAARVATGEILKREFHSGWVAVRINAISGSDWLEDLLSLRKSRLDAVVIPKVKSPDDVFAVDAVLSTWDPERRVGIQACIESAVALSGITAITLASDRLEALHFSGLDFCADSGFDFASESALAYPRAALSVAAHAAGIVCVDCAYLKYQDLSGLLQDALEARRLGYRRKWAIHPKQIATIRQAFAPGPEAARRADDVRKAYEAAKIRGDGVIALEGEMVDEATLRLLDSETGKRLKESKD
jgi:citrate lyase subunit beta/citryl-CoA lyase